MSTPYEAVGRTAHKRRRRSAIVAATRALLADGVTPTVERAALAAGVSRTTAYRYFPSRRALLAAAHPEIETESLLGDEPAADVEARLARAVDGLIRITLETEPQQRATLRLSLEADGAGADELLLRQGRAIGWLEEALEPLRERMGADEVRRLALAIRCACGIEALVWLTDVARLTREDAAELMRWSALSLLRGGTDGAARAAAAPPTETLRRPGRDLPAGGRPRGAR